MKPFTAKQLVECEFNIPNLHSDFRFIDGTRRNWDGREYSVKKLEVKGSRIIDNAEGSGVYINPNDWYELLSISKNSARIVARATHVCKWAELALKDAHNADTASLDALYYLSNPPTLRLLNGKLRKGIYKEIVRRQRSHTVNYSMFTKLLLDTVINEVKSLNPAFTNDQVVQHLRTCFGITGLGVCCLSNTIYSETFLKYDNFGGDTKCYFFRLNPEDFGYRIENEINRYNHIWVHETQVLYRGRVYQRDTLTMQHCPQCDTDAPAEGFDDGVCWECTQTRYKIHNYSTKVPTLLKFKAKNVKPTTIYLGIELEYETRDKDIARVKVGKALANHAIMKSDGSIHNGFEIVTCPATLDIHREEFKKFFDNLPAELYADKNTGMHVHVSRKPLNQFTIGKMTEFLNRLDNKQFIAYIAGRIDNSYARQEPNRTVTYPFAQGNGDRYNALNLQNSETVEFRIFSTPETWEAFASRLEFCQALTDYCQPAQVGTSLKHLTHHSSFINWLRSNRKAYPELANHLKGFA